jgi:hypothetical protein
MTGDTLESLYGPDLLFCFYTVLVGGIGGTQGGATRIVVGIVVVTVAVTGILEQSQQGSVVTGNG